MAIYVSGALMTDRMGRLYVRYATTRSPGEPARYPVDRSISRCVLYCAEEAQTSHPLSKETQMAKKSAPKLASALVFKKEWIFDPGPEFFHMNKAAVTKVNQLKDDFTKQVNAVIKQGQT
jgi:hypothetical protein